MDSLLGEMVSVACGLDVLSRMFWLEFLYPEVIG